MKVLGVIAAVLLVFVAAVVLFPPAATPGPEPILHGRDVCARCRMHITQPGYAAEARAADGFVSKYDDLGCLLLAGQVEPARAWVEDQVSAKLVALERATLVRGKLVSTPMGYGIAAFEDAAAAHAFAESKKGAVVALRTLVGELAKERQERGTAQRQ